jgi:hypothetical protein
MKIHQAPSKEEQQTKGEINNITRIRGKTAESMGMKSIKVRLITDELVSLLMGKIMMKSKKMKERIEIGIRIKNQKIQTV